MNEKARQALIAQLVLALNGLTLSQLELIRRVIAKLATKTVSHRNPASQFISEAGLSHIGDALLAHHAMAQRPLSKESFEHALQGALTRAGHTAVLSSRGNPGHDLTVDGVPISLKTQADAGIKLDFLHISKYMELGSGKWELALLRDQFLAHMRSYDRIFQFRCHRQGATRFLSELVEIPKSLLQEGANAKLETCDSSRQTPKPGYGYVRNATGALKFAMYFDGGTERKLQIKNLRKDLCVVHATWSFDSAALA